MNFSGIGGASACQHRLSAGLIFSRLLHLIRVLKLKPSGYSSFFQPRAQVVRFVTLVNLPFQFYREVFATVCGCYGRAHVYTFVVHACFSSVNARRC